MYWLVDVVVILLLVLTVVGSIRAGITGMIGGIIAFLLRIVFVVAFTAGFLYLFQITGVVDALSLAFLRLIGNSGIYPSETVCDVFSLISLGVLSFVVAYLLTLVIYKIFGKLFSKIHLTGGFGVASKVIGCVVGVCLYVGVVACVFAGIHAFAEAGSFQAADEVMRANIISGFLYRVNPLNSLFSDLGFAPYLINLFHGHF